MLSRQLGGSAWRGSLAGGVAGGAACGVAGAGSVVAAGSGAAGGSSSSGSGTVLPAPGAPLPCSGNALASPSPSTTSPRGERTRTRPRSTPTRTSSPSRVTVKRVPMTSTVIGPAVTRNRRPGLRLTSKRPPPCRTATSVLVSVERVTDTSLCESTSATVEPSANDSAAGSRSRESVNSASAAATPAKTTPPPMRRARRSLRRRVPPAMSRSTSASVKVGAVCSRKSRRRPSRSTIPHPLDDVGRGSDAPLGGGERAVARLGDLGQRQPLEMAQRPRHAQLERQEAERRVERDDLGALLGRRLGRRHVAQDRLVEAEEAQEALPPRAPPRQAHRRHGEPLAHRELVREIAEVALRGDEQILEQVLHLAFAPEDAKGDRMRQPHVRAEGGGHRWLLAHGRVGHQAEVGRMTLRHHQDQVPSRRKRLTRSCYARQRGWSIAGFRVNSRA